MASASEPEDNVAPLYHYPIVVPCDLCETKDDVNSFCRNCSQNLCVGCKRLHLRSTVSRDHNVVHISEGKSSDSEATFCVEHGERLIFYCRTCAALFCQKCLNPNHKTHDFLDTDEYAKELQSKVAMVIEEKSKKVEESRQNVLHIEESKKKYADTYTKYKRSIMDTAQCLRLEVDKVEAELLSTISNHETIGLAILDEAKAQEKTNGDTLKISLDKLVRHSKKHHNISLVACANKIIDGCHDSDPDTSSFYVPAVEFRSFEISEDSVSRLFGELQYENTEFSRKHTESSTKSHKSVRLLKKKSDREMNKQKEALFQAEQLNTCSCRRQGLKIEHHPLDKFFNKCIICEKALLVKE